MFKKVFMASLLLGCLSLSGGGAQSNSLILQAGSFIGILISLVILFFFLKMISKSMGCLPSFLILCAIAAFIMYAFGMLDHGFTGIPDAVKVFLGQKNSQPQPVDPMDQIVQQAQMNVAGIQVQQMQTQPQPNNQAAAPVQPEMPVPAPQADTVQNVTISENMQPIAAANAPAPQDENAYAKIFADDIANMEQAAVLPAIQQPTQQPEQPQPSQQPAPVKQEPQGPVDLLAQLPLISGPARILNGDTLSIRGRNIVLFGIDAPELSQTCTNQRGQSYNCGRDAAIWLRDWLGNHEIGCRIMKEDSRGTLLGVCSVGSYDIAAALVNAGLAFANTNMSEIYVPYQEQARANSRGLWNGTFYMPWDWRKMQSQKAKIKVIKRKKKKKSILDI